MWGPCACPRHNPIQWVFMIRDVDGSSGHEGQAQGPRPASHPPLVPTEGGRLLSIIECA